MEIGGLKLALVCLYVFVDTVTASVCPVEPPCFCHKQQISQENSKHLVIDIMCPGRGLQDVPKIKWNARPDNVSVNKLILLDNFIDTIYNHTFGILEPKIIDLSENSIETIELGAFNSLKYSLEELYVSGNNFLVFPLSVLTNLKALRVLDISDTDTFGGGEIDIVPKSASLKTLLLKNSNGIEDVIHNLFTYLGNLTEVNLSDNTFKVIPTAIKECKNLQKLDVSQNHISDLPQNFRTLPKLKWLSLTGNIDIITKSFTPETFQGLEDSLEYLDLSGLYLNRVPSKALGVLRVLKYLKLSDTHMEHIFEGDFKGLTSLVELDLNNHRKHEMKIDKGAFVGIESSLKRLSFASCGFEAVPRESLRILHALKELDLNGNNINNISSYDFQGLNSLEVLRLEFNLHLNIKANSFKHLSTTLRELYLMKLNLKLPPTALKIIRSLQKLDISKNNFQIVRKHFFREIFAWHIVMSECNIHDISADAFLDLYKRINHKITIDINNNLLTNLSFVTHAAIFAKINLANNAIECGCHEWAVYNCNQIEILGHCSLPRSVAGERIGSDLFQTEMTRVCEHAEKNRTLCSESKVKKKPSRVICVPKEGVTDCKNVSYHAHNTGATPTLCWLFISFTFLIKT